MKNDDEQSSLMLAVIGIIELVQANIHFRLSGLRYLRYEARTLSFVWSYGVGFWKEFHKAMNHPFSIQLCGTQCKKL